MAVNISNDKISLNDTTIARSSRFRVRDPAAFKAALSLYPNIVIHPCEQMRGYVNLTTRDGTWFTNFDRGTEQSRIDEVLAEHLHDGETAHLYLIGYNRIDLQFTRYSVDSEGRWRASTRDDEEHLIAQQLRNIKVEELP